MESKATEMSQEGLRPLSARSPAEPVVARPESNLRLPDPIVIAAWPKNGRETLQIKLDSFKGQPVIDCRCWYLDKDGILRPGRGGLTVSIKHLPALAAGLAQAVDVARDTG